jgi:hypothetical protein
MVSPLLIGALLTLGTVGWVWLLLGSVQLAAALVSLWLAYETRGRNLGPVLEATPAPFPAALGVHSQTGERPAAGARTRE